jgi:hypothetical protein
MSLLWIRQTVLFFVLVLVSGIAFSLAVGWLKPVDFASQSFGKIIFMVVLAWMTILFWYAGLARAYTTLKSWAR